MNDIQLQNNGDGTYDWGFRHDDLNNVRGVQQTASSVIHAVLLHKNELKQACYEGKGCEAHNYVKLGKSDRVIETTKDAIIKACTEVKGVRSAEVTEVNESMNTYGVNIKVIRDDGKEVIIGAI